MGMREKGGIDGGVKGRAVGVRERGVEEWVAGEGGDVM